MTAIRRGARAPLKPLQGVDEAVRMMKADNRKRGQEYRELSLKLHGHLCGRCGKEFGPAEIHLLTVHHKDSNAANNPTDGSNWENLCAYCHEAEHSRELLGDFEGGSGAGRGEETGKKPATGLGTFADLLSKARKK